MDSFGKRVHPAFFLCIFTVFYESCSTAVLCCSTAVFKIEIKGVPVVALQFFCVPAVFIPAFLSGARRAYIPDCILGCSSQNGFASPLLLRHKARLKGIWPSFLIGMPKLSEPFGLYTNVIDKLMYLVLLSYHAESLQISFDCYVSLMPKRRLARLRMSRTIHPILEMGRLFGSVQRKAQPSTFGNRSRRPNINIFVF